MAKRSFQGTLTGKVVATCAGPLIYEEDEKHTFYLVADDLKTVVEEEGGKFANSVTQKTNIVVKGSTDRMYTKKVADTWTGSAKHIALEKQEMKVASKDRKESLEVIDFRAFCSKYNLDERVKEEVPWPRPVAHAARFHLSCLVRWRRPTSLARA